MDMPLATVIGHLTILVVTLLGFWFQWIREGRRHRWQEEEFDRMHHSIKANGNGWH